MSATALFRRQRDRPIAESERTTAMASVTLLLVGAAILLTLAQPHHQSQRTSPPHSASNIVQRASVPSARAPEENTTPVAPRVARAADVFLAGYLDYLYGHSTASAIKGATPALLRSLRAQPPRVSPSMRARQPRVMALHNTSGPAGLLRVSAVVNDGSLVDYSIGLRLASQDGRLLVSGLEGGA
jgi:hypothetical protein